MGVSKNRGTPKKMVYNGSKFQTLFKIPWIWGFSPYFWKHAYIYITNMFQHGFHFGALFGEISSEFSEFQELEAAPGVAKTMIGEAGFVCVLMSEKKNSTWGCR